MTPILRRTVLATAVTLALAATACGDDDDTAADDNDPPATEPAGDSDSGRGDVDAYCEASLAIETAPEPEIDFETATPEEMAAGLKTFVADVMQPLVDDAIAVVPEEIAEDADVMAGTIAEVGETGDPAAFESPEFAEAEGRVHEFDLESCGWTEQAVDATEYSFAGIPGEIPAGPLSFEFTNSGEELHELGLVRVNDGVTETAEELLALPEDAVMEKVTFQGAPLFAAPGEGDYKVVDLEPGRYIAACFVPVGTVSEDQPPAPDAAPHAFHGMVAEFTVG